MDDTQRETVIKIVQEYLRENGYNGLTNGHDCGCRLDDLAPCCSYGVLYCYPGYAVSDGAICLQRPDDEDGNND